MIGVATLYPFNFQGAALKPLPLALQEFFTSASYTGDRISNILLFIPWGWALAGLGGRDRSRTVVASRRDRLQRLGLSLGLSVLLSLGVEGLQALMPSRTSSFSDVRFNGFGGLLGGFLWNALSRETRPRWLWRLQQRLQTPRVWAIVLCIWLLLCLGTTAKLHRLARLINWNEDFPVQVGHAGRGDRPWAGEVAALVWSDRALSDAQLKHLTDPNPTQLDQIQSHLPEVLLQLQPPVPLQGGQDLPPLTTLGESRRIVRSLRTHSEFTWSAVIATQSLEQEGPAVIFSMAENAWNSNFWVGQLNRDLILRLRTPVTRQQGDLWPVLRVPNVFQDLAFHHLVIRYQGHVLDIFCDGQKLSRSLRLTPDLTLFEYVLPHRLSRLRVTPGGLGLRGMYYFIWLIPWGWGLNYWLQLIQGYGSQNRDLNRNISTSWAIALGLLGAIVPTLLLEAIMQFGQGFRLRIWLFSLGVVGLGWCLGWGWRRWIGAWRQQRVIASQIPLQK